MSHPSPPVPAPEIIRTYTAFSATRRLAHGTLSEVALRAKRELDRVEAPQLLVFDDSTGAVVDIDLRGSVAEVTGRAVSHGPAAHTPAPAPGPRGPGRPRLGVVAREVTLLPRHWEWLNRQPGGASVALRKLVEEARRGASGPDRVREAREATYRFISAMAGNEAGFEEATRALFAGRRADFEAHSAAWPEDVREHAVRLAAPSFDTAPSA
ncbi:MAG: DUF2239 family protein [Caldimonas sp.]